MSLLLSLYSLVRRLVSPSLFFPLRREWRQVSCEKQSIFFWCKKSRLRCECVEMKEAPPKRKLLVFPLIEGCSIVLLPKTMLRVWIPCRRRQETVARKASMGCGKQQWMLCTTGLLARTSKCRSRSTTGICRLGFFSMHVFNALSQVALCGA